MSDPRLDSGNSEIEPQSQQPPSQHHWMTRIVVAFLQGHLSVLLILISLIAGAIALWITPREEDPQIVVPIADVMVNMPGASAREVERQVSTRLEKLLYQIDGVEYVYSTSFPSQAIITVRFYVGQDRERSWVKLYNKIQSNIDQVPPGVTGWVVKPVEIDDVPIVNLTLYSNRYSDYHLRRMAEGARDPAPGGEKRWAHFYRWRSTPADHSRALTPAHGGSRNNASEYSAGHTGSERGAPLGKPGLQ